MTAQPTALAASHPRRWLYGGIVQALEWPGDEARVPLWDGTVADVQPGDRLLMLLTGARTVTCVGVERGEV